MAMERYGVVARGLHWSIVALFAAQYAVGWLMPDVHRATPAEGLIALHLTLGFVILAVVAVAIVWRLMRTPPLFSPDIPRWQALLSKIVHVLLYVLALALPVTGWLNASRRTWQPYLFAVLPMPRLPYSATATGSAIGEIHSNFGWVVLAVIGFHAFAAFYHLFTYKRERFWRM